MFQLFYWIIRVVGLNKKKLIIVLHIINFFHLREKRWIWGYRSLLIIVVFLSVCFARGFIFRNGYFKSECARSEMWELKVSRSHLKSGDDSLVVEMVVAVSGQELAELEVLLTRLWLEAEDTEDTVFSGEDSLLCEGISAFTMFWKCQDSD